MLIYLLDPYHLGWHAEPNALFIGPMTLRWDRMTRLNSIYILPFWGFTHPLAQTTICPVSWRRETP
jgi:hypothetical protein